MTKSVSFKLYSPMQKGIFVARYQYWYYYVCCQYWYYYVCPNAGEVLCDMFVADPLATVAFQSSIHLYSTRSRHAKFSCKQSSLCVGPSLRTQCRRCTLFPHPTPKTVSQRLVEKYAVDRHRSASMTTLQHGDGDWISNGFGRGRMINHMYFYPEIRHSYSQNLSNVLAGGSFISQGSGLLIMDCSNICGACNLNNGPSTNS